MNGSTQSVPHSSPAPRAKGTTPTPDPPVSGEKNPTQGPRKQSVAPNAQPLAGSCSASCTDGPDDSSWPIGVTPEGNLACRGTALQCNGATCSGSPYALGDTMVLSDANVQITDMNSLWQNQSKYGWLYQGKDGNRYVQLDLSSAAGKALAGDFFKIDGTIRSYSKVKLWNGSVPAGTGVHRCETRGLLLL